MPFRVSFFFEVKGDLSSGGSLNFWNNSGDVSAVVTAAKFLRTNLNNATGAGFNWPFIRIADVSNFRAVTPLKFVTNSVAGGTERDADFVNTAGLLKVYGPEPYVVSQWFRGLEDGSFNRDGRWLPQALQQNALNTVFATFTDSGWGWCIRTQNKQTPRKVIQAVTLGGIVTIDGHGYATADRVRISRTKGIPGLNQIWTVQRIDSNNFQLIAIPIGGFTGGYTGPGKAQLQVLLYQAIRKAEIVRATSHKTGRPFGLSSGRRKPLKK